MGVARKILSIALVLALACGQAMGGMNDLLQRIAESEFEFQKSDSALPYPPFAWVRAVRYQELAFETDQPALQGVTFNQHSFGHTFYAPVYVSERDMVLAGYYYGYTEFDFDGGTIKDGHLHMIGAGGAWLRQLESDWVTGLFTAPVAHSNIDGGSPWGTDWYLGGLVRHYYEPTLQLFFGGIYLRSFGENIIYPYLGAIWLPHPRLSVAATLPWPSVSYALSEKTIARLGAGPSGAQWRVRNDSQIYHDYGGWDLGLTVEHMAFRHLWIGGSIGWSGLRAFSVNAAGDTDFESALAGKPYIALILSLRP